MSVAHRVFGSADLKLRSRWFLAFDGRGSLAYVRQRRFCGMPYRPSSFISRPTRFTPGVSPSSRRSSWMRRLPSTPSLAACNSRASATAGCPELEHSAPGCATRNSRRLKHRGADTSCESERRRDTARSCGTSLRFLGEERCCQFNWSLQHFIKFIRRSHKVASLAPPTKHVRVDAEILRHAGNRRSRHAGQSHSFLLVLFGILLSCHRTPLMAL